MSAESGSAPRSAISAACDIDLDFVDACQVVVDKKKGPLLEEFRDLTGVASISQVAAIGTWAKGQGVELESCQKAYLAKLLGEEEEEEDEDYDSLAGDDVDALAPALPENVRRALEIRSELGSASVKKLPKMKAIVCQDGRAHGLIQYHAGHTGRFGGRLLQPQNFPRGELNCDPELAVTCIMSGHPEVVELVLGTSAIKAVASSLRHALIPDPGNVFLVGDYAQIEARIVLALAGQHDKTALMAAGVDPYLNFADVMFRKPPGTYTDDDKDVRQKGKGGVLGCGFQCGPANFNVKFLGGKDLETAERIVATYRKEWAPKVPVVWYALQRESLRCVKTGMPTDAYGVVFQIEGDFLTATLPSRWQKLWYYCPMLAIDRFGRECWQYRSCRPGPGKDWVQVYGGLLCENVVQALARGLLCAAIDRLEKAGFPVVLTVHDEIIVETNEWTANPDLFEKLMAAPTVWSDELGIPIEVKAWEGYRYAKR